MLSTSFKTEQEFYVSLRLIPQKPTLNNYSVVLLHTDYVLNILNSLIVSSSVTLICIIAAGFSGYALSRTKGLFFRIYTDFLLALYMIPLVLTMIPLFVIFKNIGLFDTRTAPILSYSAGYLPVSIWILKGHFDSIPTELEESAYIDGASKFKAFSAIIAPISLPGIAAVGILAFINSWKEFLLANIFMKRDVIKTVTLGLFRFVQAFRTDYGYIMASATLAIIPIFVFLIFSQKSIIQGFTAGAIKQ